MSTENGTERHLTAAERETFYRAAMKGTTSSSAVVKTETLITTMNLRRVSDGMGGEKLQQMHYTGGGKEVWRDIPFVNLPLHLPQTP